MKKIYSAVKLPQESLDILNKEDIELTMHDELTTPSEEEVREKSKDVDAIISGVNVTISKDIIEANKDLKVIANIGAGVNNVDIDAAKDNNIILTNTPGRDSVASTAETALALILATSRNVLKDQEMVKNNAFEGWQVMGFLGGHQVAYKNLFIIGFGNIGQEIARMAKGLHMNISYNDIKDRSEFKEVEKELGAEYLDLEEGLKKADYIVLQMNYTDENYHFIDEEKMEMMNEKAYLINTSSGDVLDEDALAKALKDKKLRGAALDVHENEPKMNEELMKLDNVVMTPHIGNDTYEARTEMAVQAAEDALRVLNGEEAKNKVE